MELPILLVILVIATLIFIIRDICKADEKGWTLEEVEELNRNVQKSIDEYTERDKE